MAQSYVLVADVLGFSAIMRNVPADSRAERLSAWLDLIARSVSENLRHQVVSDTVFVTAPPTNEGLSELIDAAKHMLEQGAFNSLPLRGAIGRGDVEWLSDAVWGAGIVDAYALGQRSEWLGIVLDQSTDPLPDEFFDARRLVTYPTPFKDGPVRMHANVRWAAPPASALVQLTTSGFLFQPEEVLGWSWLRKVQATSDFRLYLDLIDAAGIPCSGYTANLGSHLYEKFIEVALPIVRDEWADWIPAPEQSSGT